MATPTSSTKNPVFYISAIFIGLLVLVTILFTKPVGDFLTALQSGIVSHFGWFYIVAVAGFLFFVLFLFFSRYGNIRLGGDDDEPEYSYTTWFAMLFSAGMGIGLLFYGVAEPILHFSSPLESQPATVRAAREAMQLTFFHWGLHAWGIYIVVGLALAFFAYRHNLPLTIRSTLYPLLGRRIYGPIGNTVEILAVIGTLFGVATSLGFGVSQINSGLNYLGMMDVSTANQLWLIAGITLLATISVISGLDRGIRLLSEANLGFAALLLIFVLIAGPTVFLLSTLIQSIGAYVQSLIALSFRTSVFRGIEWQSSWTMFYWGWWISWSPFVGMFIARISKGRTIREFIGGALFAPTLLGFLWFSVFGGTALHMEMFGAGGIAAAVADSVPTALFIMFDQLPLAAIMSTLAVLVVGTFFITSSDSGSLVIDILTSGGNPNPPLATRAFWAILEGLVAAVLLLTGGLAALQSAAIAAALPFSIVMIFMCFSLLKGLRSEAGLPQRSLLRPAFHGTPPAALSTEEMLPVSEGSWQAQLKNLVGRKPAIRAEEPDVTACRSNIRNFIQEAAAAFENISEELRRHGRETSIEQHRYQIALIVLRDGNEEFSYTLRGRVIRRAAYAFPELRGVSGGLTCYVEVVLRGGVIDTLKMDDLSQEKLYQHFVNEYAKWVGW